MFCACIFTNKLHTAVKYKIAVKTGDVRGAGTDANVFIQIFGENGDTGDRKLESSGNNFERGKTDIFTVEAIDLGELAKIRVGHDGSGVGSGWYETLSFCSHLSPSLSLPLPPLHLSPSISLHVSLSLYPLFTLFSRILPHSFPISVSTSSSSSTTSLSRPLYPLIIKTQVLR